MADGYRMEDDSVTEKAKGAAHFSGKSVSTRGEDVIKKHQESGRFPLGLRGGKSQRPMENATARDATSVDAQDPIDPAMPYVPPP